MKSSGLRKKAIDEIAKEKARVLGKKYPETSPIEEKAEAIKRDFEYQKWILPKPPTVTTAADSASEFDFQEIYQNALIERKASQVPLDLWMRQKKTEKEEVKPHSINAATVTMIAKKIMANEWRRAKGKPQTDHRLFSLEKEAATWKERREAQKRQEAEEKQRTEKLKDQLRLCLRIFGDKLYEARENVTSEMATRLFEETFDTLGKVADLKWEEDGCRAVIETWEEKKRRRFKRRTEPNLYELRVDKELNIVSYEKIKDEKKQRAEQV